jgi:hypothetical protein
MRKIINPTVPGLGGGTFCNSKRNNETICKAGVKCRVIQSEGSHIFRLVNVLLP